MKPLPEKTATLWLLAIVPIIFQAMIYVVIPESLLDSCYSCSFVVKSAKLVGLAIIGSVFFGGIQYALLLIGFWLWQRRKSIICVNRALWYLPLIFAPISVLPFLVLLAISISPFKINNLLIPAFIVGSSIALGYFYILLIKGLLRMFRRYGFICVSHTDS